MSGTQKRSAGTRFRLRHGVVVGALCAAILGTAGAAWDGEQTVVLGDSFSSAFEADPGEELHLYRFYAPASAKLQAKMRLDSDGDVKPLWKVVDAAGDDVPLGTRSTGRKIKNLRFKEGGFYALQVVAGAGTGSTGGTGTGTGSGSSGTGTGSGY